MTRPGPASHVPTPANGRAATNNGATQQTAARTTPAMPTAKVTVCWPAQAAGATIIEPISAKALKFFFMADLLLVSGAKQQRGDVVEGEGGDHEHGRHPESDLNDAAGDRARAGRAVGAGSP